MTARQYGSTDGTNINLARMAIGVKSLCHVQFLVRLASHLMAASYKFIAPIRMKGRVDLVGGLYGFDRR